MPSDDLFLYSLGSTGHILPLWLYFWIRYARRKAVLNTLKRRYGPYAVQRCSAEFEQLLMLNAIGATCMGLIVGSVLEVLFAGKHMGLLLFALYGLVFLRFAIHIGQGIETRIKQIKMGSA